MQKFLLFILFLVLFVVFSNNILAQEQPDKQWVSIEDSIRQAQMRWYYLHKLKWIAQRDSALKNHTPYTQRFEANPNCYFETHSFSKILKENSQNELEYIANKRNLKKAKKYFNPYYLRYSFRSNNRYIENHQLSMFNSSPIKKPAIIKINTTSKPVVKQIVTVRRKYIPSNEFSPYNQRFSFRPTIFNRSENPLTFYKSSTKPLIKPIIPDKKETKIVKEEIIEQTADPFTTRFVYNPLFDKELVLKNPFVFIQFQRLKYSLRTKLTNNQYDTDSLKIKPEISFYDSISKNLLNPYFQRSSVFDTTSKNSFYRNPLAKFLHIQLYDNQGIIEVNSYNPIQSKRVKPVAAVPQYKMLHKTIIKKYPDWIVGVLLFTLFVFAWLRIYFGKYITNLFRSAVNYTLSNKFFRERNTLYIRSKWALVIIYSLNMGLFIFEIIYHYNVSIRLAPSVLYILCCLFFLIAFWFNSLILRFLGFVFRQRKIFHEYQHNITIYKAAVGVAIFPVIIALPYISTKYALFIIIVGTSAISLGYFSQLIRGFRIIIDKHISIFYMILYLCTLEILPILVVFEMVSSFV